MKKRRKRKRSGNGVGATGSNRKRKQRPPVIEYTLTKNGSSHIMFPVRVSREFREYLLGRYPALQDENHADAENYRRIMQYVLFGNFRDDETGELVIPYELMAALVGKHPKAEKYAAQDWIERFSRDVLPLAARGHIYRQGMARTIRPVIDMDILELLKHLSSDTERRQQGEKLDDVWFISGTPVTAEELARYKAQEEAQFRERAEDMPEDHPASALMQYLLSASQGPLQRILEQNLPAVRRAAEMMPVTTERERVRRLLTEDILANLDTRRRMYYARSKKEKTVRLSAIGRTILGLPKELRKMAVGLVDETGEEASDTENGVFEIDAKACQLAVVAAIWKIPEIEGFLRSEKCIWTELTGFIDLPKSEYKGAIKEAIYSIIFGAATTTVQRQLKSGSLKSPPVDAKRVSKLFRHQVIKALLTARKHQMAKINEEGIAVDAFGKPYKLKGKQWYYSQKEGRRKPKTDLRSVLSGVVQSYEVRLMLSLLPVLESDKQIYLLYWLHDGICVKFGNRTKRDRQLGQMKKAFAKEAKDLEICTELEISPDPTNLRDKESHG